MARSVRRVLRWSGVGVLGIGGAVGVGCAVSPGFRRSCQFWSTIAPFVLEHSRIKARARYIDGCDDQELDRRLSYALPPCLPAPQTQTGPNQRLAAGRSTSGRQRGRSRSSYSSAVK